MKMPFLHRLLALVLVAAAAPAWSMTNAEKECGTLEWNYGPIDYRTSRQQQRQLVERPHFPPGVETLTKTSTGPFGADLRYTLSVFPNHPRALMTMERLVDKERRDPPQGAEYKLECFYERALRFKSDDHVVRLLYVNFLIRHKRNAEASTNLAYVADTTQDNPLTQLNVGMLYADMGDYDHALVQAHRIIAMGFDRRELRDRLTAAGKWVEPAPAADAASAPNAAASAPAAPAASAAAQ